MMPLPPEFIRAPIAHRGLHGPGVPENSLAAARAAISAGYGIELDIQLASDGTPMVFHDYEMSRLTGEAGMISACTPAELASRRLLGSDEPIPTLAEMLELVAGQVPLLIEIKDQDGRLGPEVGDLQKRVAEVLKDYTGPAAIMSFNPHTVKAFHDLMPELPVGLTSCSFPAEDWPLLDLATRDRLAALTDFDTSGSCFISHDKGDLGNPRVDALKSLAVPILCWTIRSEVEETTARRVADNITFEGYGAGLPEPSASEAG